jgi:2',3'-cyclic-nucleotide 2'-phosphodiesterase (5'-nucleotidase family)
MQTNKSLRGCLRRLFLFGGLYVVLLPVQARTIHLSILNTTDMHGAIRHAPERYAGKQVGSLLQCATLIRRVRMENANTLLLDCGDVFQGTAESYLTQGMVMSKAMNALGYDAVAVGNHEFDWGVAPLGNFLGQMVAVPLAANLRIGPRSPDGFRRIQPYVMKEVGGLRVAVVGLTTPNLHNWFRDLPEHDVAAMDSRSALERILPEIRKQDPHILILLVHQGLLSKDDAANEINAICRRFGEFDAVLGGHLHWVLPGAHVGRVDYAQAGADAQGVLRMDLTYDTTRKEVVDKQFTFLPVSPDVPEDPALSALVAEDIRRADLWMDSIIGKTLLPLTASPAIPGLSPVHQLLCRSIADATEAEVVLHGVFSNQGIQPGDIRISDIWRLVPYENTIGCAWLQVSDLQRILEEAADHLGGHRYMSAWGLRYEIHPYAPHGKRIRNIRAADGTPIHGRRRIKTAMNSYQLAGGGGRFPELVKAVNQPVARLGMMEETTRDMVIRYVQKHADLQIVPGTNVVVHRAAPRKWKRN